MTNDSAISSLRLANFKGFKSPITLPLAPITLILGANSSGKSSVLQGIRLLSSLSRTGGHFVPWDSDDLQLISHRYSSHQHAGGEVSLGIAGPAADVEVFEDEPLDWRWSFTISIKESINSARIIHPKFGDISLQPVPRHDEKETAGPFYYCAFGETLQLLANRYSWKAPSSPSDAIETLKTWIKTASTRIRSERASTGYRTTLLRQFEVVVAEMLREELDRLPARHPQESPVMAIAWLLQLRLAFQMRRALVLDELGLSSDRGPTIEMEVRELLDRHLPAFVGLARSTNQLEELEVDELRTVLASQLERALTSVRVLETRDGTSPLTDLARCADSLSEAVFLGPSRDVPRRSDLTSVHPTASHGSRVSQFGYLKSETLLSKVNDDLKALELPYELVFAQVENVSTPWLDGGKILCLRDQGGTVLGLQDVGFGVGQVLPIIIALHDSRLLLVEQPELHLHPRLQASLIDIAARRIKENGGQLIFETHSEHMVHRLGRLIRTNVLDPTDVSIIALSTEQRHSENTEPTAHRIRLDSQGWPQDPWPQGFFYDDLDDLLTETDETVK